MNVMAQAHKEARFIMSTGVNTTYRVVFKGALITAHKEYKAMNEADKAVALLKADTIAKFEARVVELKAILNTTDANKFMVVCGDEHPMPINFEAENAKWPWTNVEGASKWNSVQFANANASKVVNGNAQVGKAVKVADHIEWDIANLEKLIKDLKAE